jgi:hypothetical protein
VIVLGIIPSYDPWLLAHTEQIRVRERKRERKVGDIYRIEEYR